MSADKSPIKVRDVAHHTPILVDGLATVQEAVQLMNTRNVSALVVSRRDEGDEYGLVLLTEVARQVVSQNRSLSRTSVYEVMIKPAPSVDADMDIKYAIRHMTRFGLSHCIVLHGRELAGVVSQNEMTLRCTDA